MLWLERNRVYFRLFAVITLVGLCPSTFGAPYYLSVAAVSMSVSVPADGTDATTDGDELDAVEDAESAPPAPMYTQVQRVWSEASTMDPERAQIRYAAYRPVSIQSPVAEARKAAEAAMAKPADETDKSGATQAVTDEPDNAAEPTQVAQVPYEEDFPESVEPGAAGTTQAGVEPGDNLSPAETLVVDADAYSAGGNLTAAAQAYVRVVTEYPTEFGACMDAYNRLKKMANDSGKQGTDTILNALPGIGQMAHENEYAMLGSLCMHVGRHYEGLGNMDAARGYFAKTAEICREFMWLYPASTLQILTVSHYAEASAELGAEAKQQTVDELEAAIESLQPCMSRLAALYSLGYTLKTGMRELSERTFIMAELSTEIATEPYVAEALASETTFPLAKAYIEYARAYSAYALAEPTMALYDLEQLDGKYADAEEVDEQASFLRARIIAELNASDPYVGILAYSDFLARAKMKLFTRHARLEMAVMYQRGKDYVQATNMFNDIISEFPGTEVAMEAQRHADFIAVHIADTYDVATVPVTPPAPVPSQIASVLCGPEALSRMLGDMGIDANADTIATFAGTSERGTTMQGLIDAARHFNVQIDGVEVEDFGKVREAFVLHVDGTHFVYVEPVDNRYVLVSDANAQRELVEIDALAARSTRRALILSTPREQIARKLDPTVLETTWGAGWPPYVTPLNEDPLADNAPPTCRTSQNYIEDDGSVDEQTGKIVQAVGRGSAAGNADIRLASYSVNPGNSPWVSGTAGLTTGGVVADYPLNLPGRGVSGSVEMRNLEVTIVDSRMALAGKAGGRHSLSDYDMGGIWSTAFGDPSTGTAPYYWQRAVVSNTYDCSYNIDNNLCGSKACYNHIVKWILTDWRGRQRIHAGFTWCVSGGGGTSTPGPASVTGDANGDGATEDVWEDNGRVATSNAASSAATDALIYATNNVGKIWTIKDWNDNKLEFFYQSGTNKVTKIEGSDGRSINYTYDGSNRVSTVTLKNGATSIFSMEYGYTTDGRTLTFNGVGTNYTAYEYDTNGRLTSYRNAEGDVTTFTYTLSGVDVIQTVVTYPDGSRFVVERSTPTDTEISVMHEEDTGGGTWVTRSKTVYTLSAVGSRKVVEVSKYLDLYTKHTWTYSYDYNGDLSTVVAPNASTYLTMTYSGPHVIDTVQLGSETATDYDYDTSTYAEPVLDAVTLSDGTTWDYLYDAKGNVTKVTHPSLGTNGMQYAYNTYGQLTKSTLPLAGAPYFTYAYYTSGELSSVTDPNSNVTTYSYDAFGNVTKVTDPLNHDTDFTYSMGGSGCGACGAAAGLVESITDDLSNDTQFEYNLNGDMTLVTDAMSFDTAYEYDTMGRLTRIEPQTSAPKPSQTMEYDIFGNLTKATDYEGVERTMEYDWKGRMTKESDDEGWTKYSYTSEDQLYQVTVGTGAGAGTTLFSHTYNGSLRLSEITDAVSKKVKYTYDAAGRLTLIGGDTTGTFNETHYFYHSTTGQLSKVQYEYGPSSASYDEVTYTYDDMGRLSTISDWISSLSGNAPLEYDYDVLGRITQITDYDGEDLTYVYDAAGRLSSMTDYHGATTTYAYYTNNRLSTLTAPGSKTWTYAYNALGQPTQVVLPNGMATLYGYDGRNRLTLINHKDALAGSSVASYTYALDKTGSIDGITELDGTAWAYGYDGRYRLTSATRTSGPNDGVVADYAYTYDARDNMLTKVAPFEDDFNDGNSTGWVASSGAWSASGYTMASTTPAAATWRYFYKGASEPDSEIQFSYCNRDTSGGNKRCEVFVRREYGSNELVRVIFYPGSAVLQQYDDSTYTTLDTDTAADSIQDTWYDVRVISDGADIEVWWGEQGEMLTKILETSSATVLVTNQYNFQIAPDATVEFDNIRILGDGVTATTTFAVNNANEMTTMTDVNGTTTFAYDGWGRMASKSRGGKTAAYGFRYGHFLSDYDTDFPDEGDVEYVTGGDWKRRDRDTASGGISYRWSGEEVVNEDDGVGLVRTYVGLNAAVIQGGDATSGSYEYHLNDFLASTRGVFSQTKSQIGDYEYSPFGNELGWHGSATSTHLYTTHDWDPLLSSYYAPYRYLIPQLARWEKTDPLYIVDGANIYKYASNNPVLYADLDGRLIGILLGGALLIGGALTIKNWLDNYSNNQETLDEALNSGPIILDPMEYDSSRYERARKACGKLGGNNGLGGYSVDAYLAPINGLAPDNFGGDALKDGLDILKNQSCPVMPESVCNPPIRHLSSH